LKEALGSVVFLKLDAEKAENEELVEQLKIKGYPTFVLANADGETLNRWSGFDDADSFIATLAEAAADPTTIEEKTARFEREPALNDAVTLAEYHGSSGGFAEAASYYERAQELAAPDEGFEYELFYVHRWGYEEEAFAADELKVAADRAMASGRLTSEEYLRLARLMSMGAGVDSEWSAAPYIEGALAATEHDEDPELESARRHVMIQQALKVNGDEDRALVLKRETLDEGWEEDTGELNSFAWWCFENKLNLEEAEALARRGVELSEDGGEKAMILDTAAEIVYLRGDEEGALALVRQAIELDPENDYYKEQLAKFSGETPDAM
jgi:tetratricopeptide (TPR) repeat protein